MAARTLLDSLGAKFAALERRAEAAEEKLRQELRCVAGLDEDLDLLRSARPREPPRAESYADLVAPMLQAIATRPAMTADEKKRAYLAYYPPPVGRSVFEGVRVDEYEAEANLLTSVLLEDYGDTLGLVSCLNRYLRDAGRTAAVTSLSRQLRGWSVRERSMSDKLQFVGRNPALSNRAYASVAAWVPAITVANLAGSTADRGLPPIHRSIWYLIPESRRKLATFAMVACPDATLDSLRAHAAERSRAWPVGQAPTTVPLLCREFGIAVTDPLPGTKNGRHGIYTFRCMACERVWAVGGESGRRSREQKVKDAKRGRLARFGGHCPVCYIWRPSDARPRPRATCWSAWLDRLEVFGPRTTPLEWFALAPEACLYEMVAGFAAGHPPSLATFEFVLRDVFRNRPKDAPAGPAAQTARSLRK